MHLAHNMIFFDRFTYDRRRRKLTRQLPEVIDLLLMCTDAGLSLDQSLLKTAAELSQDASLLSGEIRSVCTLISAGRDRTLVMEDFARKWQNPAISAFCLIINQSTRYGTPLSASLRTLVSDMRQARIYEIEAQINKLPLKMTLITMILSAPPIIIMLVGPSLHAIIKSLGS